MAEGRGEDIVRFMVSSRKRLKTLIFLSGGEGTLQSIKEATNSSSPAIIPQLRRMERMKLLKRKGRNYSLSSTGKVLAEHLRRLTATAEVFERYPDFWNSHELSALPEKFRMRLYELGKYRVLRADRTDPFIPHRVYIKNLEKAEWMLGVSPVLHPEYPQAVLKLVRLGKKVSLILTKEVIDKITVEYPEELREGLKYSNANLMICSNAYVAFTVTDFFFSMMLPLNGEHAVDMYTSILSFEESAIRLGCELYNHYRSASYPLTEPAAPAMLEGNLRTSVAPPTPSFKY